jgi:hypothetical protein
MTQKTFSFPTTQKKTRSLSIVRKSASTASMKRLALVLTSPYIAGMIVIVAERSPGT